MSRWQMCSVANQVTLPVVPTALPTASAAPMDVEAGRLVPIDLATAQGSPLVRQGNVGAAGPAAVVTRTEEQLLELATSLPPKRTIRHQPQA